MSQRIQDRIKEIIVEHLFLDVSPDSIGDDQDLLAFVENDSVRLFEIVVGLEAAYEISFADNEFSVKKFSTVNGIAAVVQAKLKT
ncbi:MAG: acyl carrier protein [Planctomycetota bacterium]